MHLRKLEMKDRFGMLEWMKDAEIMSHFRLSRELTHEEKVKQFIENSFDEVNRHYAIVEDEDEYLGTISLKNIDKINNNAEYAIVLRRQALSTGVAKIATNQLINIAFNELNLYKVYLNVLSNNLRAIRFYEKLNFKLEGEFKGHLYIDNKYMDIKWYGVTKEEYLNERV